MVLPGVKSIDVTCRVARFLRFTRRRYEGIARRICKMVVGSRVESVTKNTVESDKPCVYGESANNAVYVSCNI